jgi:hypothetical protein
MKGVRIISRIKGNEDDVDDDFEADEGVQGDECNASEGIAKMKSNARKAKLLQVIRASTIACLMVVDDRFSIRCGDCWHTNSTNPPVTELLDWSFRQRLYSSNWSQVKLGFPDDGHQNSGV